MSRKIYLDFNASTPICPEAVEAMHPLLTDHYGNPSSLHWAGMPAKDAVERARGQVAACDAGRQWVGMPQVQALRDRFWDGLRGIFGEKVTLNGHPAARLPNTINVNFVGRVGAEVLAMLPKVVASTGSACHAGSVTLFPVLAAMGVLPEEGMGAVRFSLGRTTTWEELGEVLGMLEASISHDSTDGG